MRAIDADAYLESVKPRGISDELWKESNTYKSVASMPTIEPDSLWIPCKERLPETDGKYLVSVNLDGHEYCDEDYWHRDNWNMYFKKSITAWMPKIEPYREGEG